MQLQIRCALCFSLFSVHFDLNFTFALRNYVKKRLRCECLLIFFSLFSRESERTARYELRQANGCQVLSALRLNVCTKYTKRGE